ncbi:hypothetical protein EVAR_89737_1 [Eumeta japonica]|uniref:Uncharacterized protein n=1 Tax=Eumeta variegata TaxID=151549 RepID=A0A4C1Y6G1_EUMVA|nr:hypothetical protein EVAR_89737_1 [Eumeta japonica]
MTFVDSQVQDPRERHKKRGRLCYKRWRKPVMELEQVVKKCKQSLHLWLMVFIRPSWTNVICGLLLVSVTDVLTDDLIWSPMRGHFK